VIEWDLGMVDFVMLSAEYEVDVEELLLCAYNDGFKLSPLSEDWAKLLLGERVYNMDT